MKIYETSVAKDLILVGFWCDGEKPLFSINDDEASLVFKYGRLPKDYITTDGSVYLFEKKYFEEVVKPKFEQTELLSDYLEEHEDWLFYELKNFIGCICLTAEEDDDTPVFIRKETIDLGKYLNEQVKDAFYFGIHIKNNVYTTHMKTLHYIDQVEEKWREEKAKLLKFVEETPNELQTRPCPNCQSEKSMLFDPKDLTWVCDFC